MENGSSFPFYGFHTPVPTRHHPVNHRLLFLTRFHQVNPGCFEIFVSKQIGEQGNIAAFFDKTLGKPVAECMRMYHFRCHVVGEGDGLSWLRMPPGEMGEPKRLRKMGPWDLLEKGKPFEGIGSE